MTYFFCLVIGAWIGVLVMCILAVARDADELRKYLPRSEEPTQEEIELCRRVAEEAEHKAQARAERRALDEANQILLRELRTRRRGFGL